MGRMQAWQREKRICTLLRCRNTLKGMNCLLDKVNSEDISSET